MSVIPPPPWIWMARSITAQAMRGTATLIAAISVAAPFAPWLSISHAVLSTSSRACSTSMRDSAICSRTTPCSESGRLNATRDCARRTIRSIARSAIPISRMQWWMRPGPSRAWAIRNPPPSSPSRLVTGTRTSVSVSSECPCWSW